MFRIGSVSANGFLLLVLPVLFMFSGCSAKVSSEAGTEIAARPDPAEALGKQTFGDDFKIVYNVDTTFALLYKTIKVRPQSPDPTLSMLICDAETGRILFRESFPRAAARWINASVVEVSLKPEVLPVAGKTLVGFRFDVGRESKLPLYQSNE